MNPDVLIGGWFLALNTAAFIGFGLDKWRARRAGRRVSERTLVFLGALGGWPGGLVAMALFRHKTAKGTFKLKYALALLPFAAAVWISLQWR